MTLDYPSQQFAPKTHKPMKQITHNGQTHTVRKWVEILGVSRSEIHRRHNLGLPIDKPRRTK